MTYIIHALPCWFDLFFSLFLYLKDFVFKNQIKKGLVCSVGCSIIYLQSFYSPLNPLTVEFCIKVEWLSRVKTCCTLIEVYMYTTNEKC